MFRLGDDSYANSLECLICKLRPVTSASDGVITMTKLQAFRCGCKKLFGNVGFFDEIYIPIHEFQLQIHYQHSAYAIFFHVTLDVLDVHIVLECRQNGIQKVLVRLLQMLELRQHIFVAELRGCIGSSHQAQSVAVELAEKLRLIGNLVRTGNHEDWSEQLIRQVKVDGTDIHPVPCRLLDSPQSLLCGTFGEHYSDFLHIGSVLRLVVPIIATIVFILAVIIHGMNYHPKHVPIVYLLEIFKV